MNKPLAAIEITSKSIKLVVGYCKDNQVYVLYVLERPLAPGIVERGTIVDLPALTKEVEAISNICDASAKIKIRVTEALFALPPIGLEVFQTKQFTTVINDEGKIGEIDIRNIRNLIANAKTPLNSSLIDIIPDEFTLDQGKKFKTVPLGEISSTITVMAKVHTLPTNLVSSYYKAMNDAKITIKRASVSPLGVISILQDYEDVPADYILVDIGAKVTSLSLVGKNQLYGTVSFNWGGDDITQRIADGFEINELDAEKYKLLYGIDRRKMNFEPTVCTVEDEFGNEVKHTVNELNELIKSELDTFVNKLNSAVDVLLQDYEPSYKSLPMVVVGGGSLLRGLREYVEPKVKSETFTPITPKTVGARNPSFFNCLGLIKANTIYQGAFSDSKQRITRVTREDK